MRSSMTISILLKYYINEYEQPYYGVLSYLHDIGYTVEYELLQEAHLQDSFDSATGSVDVKDFVEYNLQTF